MNARENPEPSFGAAWSSLAGSVAIVTGAAFGGLGAHVARALVESGATVALIDRSDRIEDLGKTLDSLAGHEHFSVTADVTDEVQVDRAFDEIADRLGGADVLVHAAGVMLRKPALETSLREWSRVVEVNLTGSWITNLAAARQMKERGSGRIINVSSVYTNIVGQLPEAAYYASKGGVAQLTRGLAMEWGQFGINVNCIAPGVFYPTRMTAPLGESPEVLARMEGRTFLGRLGDPMHDIGGPAVFLASPAARYITGQVIFVDGGWSAG